MTKFGGDYSLFGYRCRDNQQFHSDLEFPMDAYKAFCRELKMKWPFEDVNPLDEKTKEHDKCQNDDLIEVIDGVTVGFLRSVLDDNSSEFLPRMLALIEAKKRVINERNLQDNMGFRSHKSDKKWAQDLAKEEFKKLFGDVSDEDSKAIARCLLLDVKPVTGIGGTY